MAMQAKRTTGLKCKDTAVFTPVISGKGKKKV